MFSVPTNKNKNMLQFFFAKSMILVSTDKNKTIPFFVLQIKTKSQANLIKPTLLLEKV